MIGTKISHWGIAINLENRSGTKLTFQSANLLLIFHRSFRNFLLHVLVCLIFSPCVNPQQLELQFENILVEGGMPVNVQNIYQDRTGYLWFATWSGLYKYDGYNFTSYKHDAEDTTSLVDNSVSVLYEDKEGIIWVGSQIGLERFDPKSEIFIHYALNPTDTGKSQSIQITSICEDKKKSLDRNREWFI